MSASQILLCAAQESDIAPGRWDMGLDHLEMRRGVELLFQTSWISSLGTSIFYKTRMLPPGFVKENFKCLPSGGLCVSPSKALKSLKWEGFQAHHFPKCFYQLPLSGSPPSIQTPWKLSLRFLPISICCIDSICTLVRVLDSSSESRSLKFGPVVSILLVFTTHCFCFNSPIYSS